jgi:prolyl 4-hydroxylase
MAWMTYLNDATTGGSTSFSQYGLDIQPERGKTLIWPAKWTHAHVGNIVTQGTKYVITGWMHFPA